MIKADRRAVSFKSLDHLIESSDEDSYFCIGDIENHYTEGLYVFRVDSVPYWGIEDFGEVTSSDVFYEISIELYQQLYIEANTSL